MIFESNEIYIFSRWLHIHKKGEDAYFLDRIRAIAAIAAIAFRVRLISLSRIAASMKRIEDFVEIATRTSPKPKRSVRENCVCRTRDTVRRQCEGSVHFLQVATRTKRTFSCADGVPSLSRRRRFHPDRSWSVFVEKSWVFCYDEQPFGEIDECLVDSQSQRSLFLPVPILCFTRSEWTVSLGQPVRSTCRLSLG